MGYKASSQVGVLSTRTLLHYAEATGSIFHVRLSTGQCGDCAPLGNDIVQNRTVARSERFELPTLGFEVRCSIQLSYERLPGFDYQTWPDRATQSVRIFWNEFPDIDATQQWPTAAGSA
jgi:hypothetical protein